MGYAKGPSTPGASELKDYERLYKGNLTAPNIEAIDALLVDGKKACVGSSRDARPPLSSIARMV
jgi:hypothetical protein